jgi:hypothetical protein
MGSGYEFTVQAGYSSFDTGPTQNINHRDGFYFFKASG